MRRLVIACDGTWNTADQKWPTNVVKLARAVKPVDENGVTQIVFYDQGVGTGNALDRITGGAFGDGLSQNVNDCYRLLVDNYTESDEIYLFGFSRGAFTARSVAGMVRKCGILQKVHAGHIAEAYELYRRRDATPDSEAAKAFRAAYARRTNQLPEDPFAVRIRCIGVWDTVGALGVPGGIFRSLMKHRYEFHDVQLSSRVQNAFHALAVDEKRLWFKPTLWTTKPEAHQRLEQVWFAGIHTNIGGGAAESGASDCALIWMVERASSCGLRFDPNIIGALHPDALAPLEESRHGFYELIPPYYRPIGTASEESLDRTTETRYRELPTYRPRNLVAYIEQRPAAIADPGSPRLSVSEVAGRGSQLAAAEVADGGSQVAAEVAGGGSQVAGDVQRLADDKRARQRPT